MDHPSRRKEKVYKFSRLEETLKNILPICLIKDHQYSMILVQAKRLFP